MEKITENLKKQVRPTYEQELVLAEMCRKDMPMFDMLRSEAKECWIMEYWGSKRAEATWNLSRMFVVAHIGKMEDVELKLDENDDLMRECKSIVENYPNNIGAEFIQERLSKYNLLLIKEDYVQITKEYIDFSTSMEKL